MRSLIAILLIVCAASIVASAEAITFSAVVDRTEIDLDQQITLQLTVSGEDDKLPSPTPPKVEGFNVFSSGRSQQLSIVNGEATASVAHRFILTPQRPGNFVIPTQALHYKGKVYSTKPISVAVAAPSRQPGSGTSSQDDRNAVKNTRQTDNFMVEAVVDKDSVFVNEQVVFTFRFYQGKRLHSSPDFTPPTATGFWVEDLPPQKNYYKTVRGKNYYVIELKTAYFPTSPGRKKIGSAKLQIKQDDLFSLFDRDPFGFFDRKKNASRKPVNLATDPVEITVMPLPNEGKPQEFSGSVGQLRMRSSIDNKEVEVNQPATVKIRISGQGNIKTLPEPEVPELEDFRVFSSGKSENVSKAGYSVGGHKEFEFSYIPRKPGTFTIPAIETNFFDPESGQYKMLRGEDYEVTVTGVSNEEIAAQGSLPPGRMDLVAKDIRFIITSRSGTESYGRLYLKNPLFIGLNVLFVIGLGAVYYVRKRNDRLAGDEGYRRKRQAVKLARQRLSHAQGLLDKNDVDAFFAEVFRAMTEYVADKFNVAAAGLTTRTVEEMLQSREINSTMAEEYSSIADECNEARFTSASLGQTEMKSLIKRAEDWIVKFEGSRK